MRKFLLLSMILIIAVTGCGPVHTGPQIDHAKLDQIVKGKTTKGEVIALFGNLPTSQTRDSSGMTTLTWVHTRRDFNYWLGIYMPAASDIVTVVFDENDVVSRFSYGGSQNTKEVWHESDKTGGGSPDLGVDQR